MNKAKVDLWGTMSLRTVKEEVCHEDSAANPVLDSHRSVEEKL